MNKELKSNCCGATIYPMVPYSGSTPYCMKCQQPCYPAIDEILAEPQGGEKTLSETVYDKACRDFNEQQTIPDSPAEPPRPEKKHTDGTICDERCPYPPPHKEEDWSEEFDNQFGHFAVKSWRGNWWKVVKSDQIKFFIKRYKTDWEAAAEKKGYEQGFKKNAELLFNEICESSKLRAEAVREERERIRGGIARLATVDDYARRMISEQNLLDLLEPNSDIH